MNTAEKNAAAVQGTAKAGEAANRTENRPSLTGKKAKQDGKDETTAASKAAQPETAKAGENKTGNVTAVADQPADPANQSAQALTAGEAGKKQHQRSSRSTLSRP